MPYKSDAQRKYFNAVLKKKDPKLVEEYNEESKGMNLPEKKESKLEKYLKGRKK